MKESFGPYWFRGLGFKIAGKATKVSSFMGLGFQQENKNRL